MDVNSIYTVMLVPPQNYHLWLFALKWNSNDLGITGFYDFVHRVLF
jgi:hypothetical protein